MLSSTVRIQKKDQKMLREMAARKKASMQEVLHQALEEYRRKLILQSANVAYAALKQDARAWKEELKEREEWETTLDDNFNDL